MGRRRLLGAAAIVAGALSIADAVNSRGGGTGKDAALSAAVGLFDKAKAALECNVCKTSFLSGTVDDCCVDYTTVDAATKAAFLPLLTQLQKRTFFKYYKVNLEKECPFWEEDGQCMMRDCSVCECSPEEIPKPWLEEDERSVVQEEVDVQPGDDCSEQIRKERACQDHSLAEKTFGKVDHSQSSPIDDAFAPWSEEADAAVWALQDEGVEDFTYVNLDLNPEKFTGYSGASAARVWGSIYWENLKGFQDSPCMEKRILFRLLSGLHSSIMTQIANDYRFDDGRWGPNTKMFVNAVGMHPDRLTNMYFAYVFVLRAVGKARPFLMDYSYETGNPEDDAYTRKLINELGELDGGARSGNSTVEPSLAAAAVAVATAGSVSTDTDTDTDTDTGGKPCVVDGYSPRSVRSTHAEEGEQSTLGTLPEELRDTTVPMCLRGFDESGLFGSNQGGGGGGDPDDNVFRDSQGLEAMALKQEFMHKFHNISRIMDCVGCEKCKLWGKLETLGLGTALKIMLFSSDEAGRKELESLNRNEIIALVNTAAQLAKSVGSVPGWRWLEVKQKGLDLGSRFAMGLILMAVLLIATGYLFRWRSPRQGEDSGDGSQGLKMTDGSGSRNQGASVGNGSSSSSSSEQAPVADDNDYSGPTTRRRAAATRS